MSTETLLSHVLHVPIGQKECIDTHEKTAFVKEVEITYSRRAHSDGAPCANAIENSRGQEAGPCRTVAGRKVRAGG